MAKLNTQDVLKLARLAKLQITEDELHQYADELSAILDYAEQLGNVKVDGLKPTAQVTGLTNVTRKDEIIEYGVSPKDLLKNAPAQENNLIKVRRVL